MHDVYLLAVPVIVIVAGILFNRHDVAVLRGEMRAEFADVKSQMQHFIDLHIGHEGRISKLEEKTK